MADVEELSGRVDFHDQVINDFKTSFDQLFERLGKVEEAINNLQSSLEGRIANLESAASAGSGDSDAKIVSLEGTVTQLQGTVSELQSSVNERMNALSAMYSNLSQR